MKFFLYNFVSDYFCYISTVFQIPINIFPPFFESFCLCMKKSTTLKFNFKVYFLNYVNKKIQVFTVRHVETEVVAYTSCVVL